MREDKWCIFHIPYYINPAMQSGSQMRPPKMIEAFKSIGYSVDVVMGYGSLRKSQINKIKTKIKNGRKYDFLYSESSTMPTLLTEKSHFPIYPFLDFSFFTYCKKNGIKIGLFYRDMHWKFEDYRKKVPFWKRAISIPFYKYDLRKYERIVDVLYLPSRQMEPLLSSYKMRKIEDLPPGGEYSYDVVKERDDYFAIRKDGSLKLFYVGGTSGLYDLTSIFKAVMTTDDVYLVVCTRKEEWDRIKGKYLPYMCDRIKIIHESGKNLRSYYMQADICCCYLPIFKYTSFSMPVKLFESLSYVTPVIVTKGIEAGNFVQKWDNGFCIEYDDCSIIKLLEAIKKNQNVLLEKHNNAVTCLMKNTWEERAKKVVRDLKGERK